MTTTYAVAVGVADVRRDPNPTSELLTQALMSRPVSADELSGDWTHVTLSDYAGWIQSDELADPPVKDFIEAARIGEYCATPLELVVVVNETHTPLFTDLDGDETQGTLYLSTVLPLLDTVSVSIFARAKIAIRKDLLPRLSPMPMRLKVCHIYGEERAGKASIAAVLSSFAIGWAATLFRAMPISNTMYLFTPYLVSRCKRAT